MKLKPLLFACFLLAGLSTFAQEKPITFGFKAGIGVTSFSRPRNEDIIIANDDKAISGFTGGAYASFTIGRISLQPGVNYVTKGAKTTEDTFGGDIVFRTYGKLRLSYLQVPINVIYNLPVKGGSFFLGGGPYIAKGLKASFTPASLDNGPDNNGDFDPISYEFGDKSFRSFKSFDYGANLLAGFRISNGLQFNFGYELGLSNIQPNNPYYYYSSTKTRSLIFSLGYQIP
ncbi:porin family protein [Mucilaginibacter gilvus]|uniref:PorT family protein n=1 Tax=Mucilaginibacter gilvus TaxID=2305909 RepID=A0A444MIN7_9SPHI|nr:porin family protein [Mucilaginibacter gilvus]RWY47981.1 PorT family protein [Mucilaginibacter gilvus]